MQNPLIAGRNVVLSGIVVGHSRGTAQAFLQDAGANVQSGFGPTTEVLITGGKPGPKKVQKAREMEIDIFTWEEMLTGLNARASSAGQPDAAPETISVRSVSPQLALVGDLPEGDEWFFEVKWDGYRCIATVIDGKVAMQSRSGISNYVEQFPKVAAELAKLPNCILDGELIVVDGNGKTSFETAHTAATGTEAFVVFDALEVEGDDIRREPLWQRREGVKVVLENCDPEGPVRISPAQNDGAALLAAVKEQGLEGIVAKRKSSHYIEGSRSSDWLKIKVRLEQEFVVLAWKPGDGRRSGMAGSILLGVRGDNEWIYAGRCGTGQEDAVWKSFTELDPHEGTKNDTDLSAAKAPEIKDAVWVEPICVVQIEFQRWTADGRLWHPSLQRIRTDKNPFGVVRES